MTCIVGMVKNGKCWVGGDRAGVSNSYLELSASPKVFQVGSYLIGFTTSFRMGQILQYSFIPPVLPKKIDTKKLLKFMVTEFIDSLRSTFKKAGYGKTVSGEDEAGTFIVAVEGHLFIVDSDYQVNHVLADYTAVGSGREPAIGAMFAQSKTRKSPKEQILCALKAAESCITTVRGPFDIKEIK